MKAWWMSWNQPAGDHRPMTFPPPDSICGWWCSGSSDDFDTLCAVVVAPTEAAAWEVVRDAKAWPDAGAERFCEPFGGELSDRFPLSDWMRPRIDALAALDRASVHRNLKKEKGDSPA